MALSYVVGTTLVDQDEVRERSKKADGDVAAFGEAIDQISRRKELTCAEPRIRFSRGVVTLAEYLTTSRVNATTPFEPVGIGKPATILLRHVYTGRLGKADMLLTSAIRDPFTTFNMAPRAINLMPKRVPKKAHIRSAAATDNGTELVYYIGALTAQSLALTFDLAFDDFPDELVDRIGGAICTAGSIPVFGPYSGCLVAVGTAIKLISKFVNALVDAQPDFSVTERLDFQVPGSPIPDSGYKIVSNDTLDHGNFRFDIRLGLVHKDTGRPYDGDEPYIVFLLDGTKNDRFKEFTPTAATAVLLSRLLSQREGSELVMGPISDALRLYSDMRFRREADRMAAEIERLPDGSEERKELVSRRSATVANILDDLLKPAC